MKKTWRAGVGVSFAAIAAGFALSGCQLAALFGGHGSQEAMYTFPKDARVLVFVDPQETVSLPPGFDAELAEKINQHLYAYKATDHIVAQDRLAQLRDKQGDNFKKLGIADIAAGTDADVVLTVSVAKLFAAPITTDNTVAQGDAEVFVKVVDRQGERLWPGDPLGVRIGAHEDPALVTDRNVPQILKSLEVQLTRRTGRMFHKYSLDDKTLLR